MVHLVYFEQELLDLQEEISKHPPLLEILSRQTDKDFYILLSEIGSYLKMAFDGDYSKEDVLRLCEIMTKKLRERREICIYSGEIHITGVLE